MADYPKRILIVEDNKIDMRLLKDILESRGYETFQAEDGLEAIDLVFADSQPYTDGYQTTRNIRARSDPSTQR